MKKIKKMNKLYVAAFVLLAVGVAAFAGAIVLVYAINKVRTGAVCAGGGALACFVGIFLALKSSAKKPKPQNNAAEEIKEDESAVNSKIAVD